MVFSLFLIEYIAVQYSIGRLGQEGHQPGLPAFLQRGGGRARVKLRLADRERS